MPIINRKILLIQILTFNSIFFLVQCFHFSGNKNIHKNIHSNIHTTPAMYTTQKIKILKMIKLRSIITAASRPLYSSKASFSKFSHKQSNAHLHKSSRISSFRLFSSSSSSTTSTGNSSSTSTNVGNSNSNSKNNMQNQSEEIKLEVNSKKPNKATEKSPKKSPKKVPKISDLSEEDARYEE